MAFAIHLTRPPGPPPKPWYDDLESLRSAIESCGAGQIQCTEPDNADAILVFHQDPARVPLQNVMSYLSASERTKAFVYSTIDSVLPLVPGFYPSLPQHNHISGTMGSPYFSVMRLDWLDALSTAVPAKWLFSYAGNSANAPVRRKLMLVNDDRGRLVDTGSHPGNLSGQTSEVYQEFHNQYAEMMRDSLFIVCPRGMGASSMRLYEAMRAGRVPVIISDDWVPPEGISWNRCSIRLAEKDVGHLGAVLREREAEALTLCRLARTAWEEHFSQSGVLQWLTQQLQRLLWERRAYHRERRWLMLDPRNARLVWRSLR